MAMTRHDANGIAVVPFTVTVDGAGHLGGVDLDIDGFYTAVVGSRPTDSTATRGPGPLLPRFPPLD